MGSSISTARIQTFGNGGWQAVGLGTGATTLPVAVTGFTLGGNAQAISTTDLVVAAPSATGSMVSGVPTVGSAVFLAVRGSDSLWQVQITSLTSGTLYFEGSTDSGNGSSGSWVPIGMRQYGPATPNASFVATANGTYYGNPAGFTFVRVRSVGALSGTPILVMSLSIAQVPAPPTALPAGSNTIGNVNVVGNGLQSPIAGTITAAVANTPGTAVTASSTGAVVLNANVAGNASFALVTSAFVGVLIFEASVDAGLNYAPIQCIREDGTGAENTYTLSTAAAFIRMWTTALAGVAYFRVRCSAFTSGSVAIVMQPGPSLIEPNPSLGGGTQNIGNVGITNPTAVLGGIYASLNPYGALRVTNEPTPSFFDPFDGSVIDTQRWVTAGTVPTQSTGSLLVNASTVASATSRITSVPTFASPGLGFEVFGCVVMVEAAPVPNVYRYWGWGSDVVTPAYQGAVATTSLAIQDGVGFELDTAGNLYAVIYAATILQYRSAAIPTTNWGGGTPHRYGIMKRSDVVFWFVEGQDLPVASTTYKAPAVQTLPIKVGAYNNSTAPAAYTFTVSAVAMHDSTSQNHTFSDPVYQWRRAGVSPASHLKVAPYSSTPGQSSPGMTTASAPVLAANVNRVGAAFTNDPASVSSVYVLLGATASTTSYTFILAPGGYYEVPFGYAGAISGICATGTATMRVTELTP